MTGPPDQVAPSDRDRDRDWRRRGACIADPDLHHPPGFSPAYQVQIKAAKNMCRSDCPVIAECRAWILAFEAGLSKYTRDGVWAAMTPEERWQADAAAQEQPVAPVPVQAPRRTCGRPCDPEVISAVARLRDDGLSGLTIARELGITESRAYRAIHHLDLLRASRDMADTQATGSG